MLRLLVVFLCLNVAFGDSSTRAPNAISITVPTSVTTTAPANETTTTAPANETTTTAPANETTTTAPANETTTTAPANETTTTAPANETTTTAPANETTTTAPANETTTTAPANETTTTPSKVTTKATVTTPKPTPTYGTYNISDGNDTFCLLAQFKATFTIHYLKRVAEENATKEAVGTIALDSTVSVNVSGDCGRLTLRWPEAEPVFTLTIEFAKLTALQASIENSLTWWLKSVSFLANLTDDQDFKNATVKMVNTSYTAPSNTPIHGAIGSYYYCKADTNLALKTEIKDYKVKVDFTDWKVEPFVPKRKDFGSGKECTQDKPTESPKDNDIVPIAVGCALAGLVLIVLIAYVIGRRKSHRGYEKV